MGKIKTKAEKKPMTQSCRSSRSRRESALVRLPLCGDDSSGSIGYREGAAGLGPELRLGRRVRESALVKISMP